MAGFEMRRIRNGLEFERNGFNDRKNFSEGSFKPKKDIQIIQVQGSTASHQPRYIVNTIYRGLDNHS